MLSVSACSAESPESRTELLLIGYFGPTVFQRDGPVENRPAGNRIAVHAEIARPFELKLVAHGSLGERRLQIAGYLAQRLGVQVIQKGLALLQIVETRAREQPVEQTDLGPNRMRCRNPMNHAFHPPAVGRLSAGRLRIVRAPELRHAAFRVADHLVAPDQIGIAQANLAARATSDSTFSEDSP